MTLQNIPLYTCTHCNYKWYPRPKRGGTLDRPKTCPNPKCHSAYWDRPRRPK